MRWRLGARVELQFQLLGNERRVPRQEANLFDLFFFALGLGWLALVGFLGRLFVRHGSSHRPVLHFM